MKLVIAFLVVLLAGCSYIDRMMERQALPDTRITIYAGQALRTSYDQIDEYRCFDGGPVMAQPYGGGGRTGPWELTCWR